MVDRRWTIYGRRDLEPISPYLQKWKLSPRDRFDERPDLLGGVEEVVGILGPEPLRGGLPRGNRDGRGVVRSAAADVVDRVADDDDLAAAEAVAVDLGRSLDRDRRQLLAAR